MIFIKQLTKKILLLFEKIVLNVYESIFISPLFGQREMLNMFGNQAIIQE